MEYEEAGIEILESPVERRERLSAEADGANKLAKSFGAEYQRLIVKRGFAFALRDGTLYPLTVIGTVASCTATFTPPSNDFTLDVSMNVSLFEFELRLPNRKAPGEHSVLVARQATGAHDSGSMPKSDFWVALPDSFEGMRVNYRWIVPSFHSIHTL